VTEILHGVSVVDPYRWLEDDKSAESRAWIKAQDDFARAEIARSPDRDAIAARFKELYYIEEVGAPIRRGRRYFWWRRAATQEKAAIYWKEGKSGAEKVLLDPNTWSPDGTVSLGEWSVSWDGKTIAYQVQKNSADEATLEFTDVATGKRSAIDSIEGAKYAWVTAWTPKGDGLYYTKVPTGPEVSTIDRPGLAEIRLHKLGESPKKDVLVREKTGDPKTFVFPMSSKDGHFLFYVVRHGWASWDVYFRDLRASGAAFKPLAVGRPFKYSVEAYKDVFYVKTDDGAPSGHIFKVDPKHAERDKWSEIVPERKGATLEAFSIIGGRLGLQYMRDVKNELEVRDLDGKLVREIPLPAMGTTDGFEGDPDDDEAYFSFNSFTYPTEIYETSVKTGKTFPFYKTRVPVDPSRFTVEQVFAASKDGTKVPIFVIHDKDFKRDGRSPLMLWGYGGYGVSQKPWFTPSVYPWIERGGAYAIANIRGGGEYGEEWHKAGMLRKKQNVFDDFIAASEFLIQNGYTQPERFVIRGGSNGGLLLGAVVTQRPELYRAALCAVPILDMLRYHIVAAGKTWIQEFGSVDDPEDFRVLYGYSPYHHIKPGVRYPSVLLLSADSDDRVDPMHARKFAAALQAGSTGGRVLLRIQRNAGHGGAGTIKSLVEERADAYAFALGEIAR
jgi:prolyl oligopeptidase